MKKIVQAIGFGSLKGVGIVATLVIIGVLLKTTNIAAGLGSIAMGSGVFVGILLGFLGVIGVAKRVIG